MAESRQPKKRLVIDLSPSEHAQISAQAKAKDVTLANFVRRALKLPEVRQGKRADLKISA